MRPLTISLPDYPYEKLTQQAEAFETSLEDLVLFHLKRDEVREIALVFYKNMLEGV